MYRVSSNQLYGLTGQQWTHWVVKYWDKDRCEIYDPLVEILEKELPIHPYNVETLEKIISRKILLW